MAWISGSVPLRRKGRISGPVRVWRRICDLVTLTLWRSGETAESLPGASSAQRIDTACVLGILCIGRSHKGESQSREEVSQSD